VLSHGAIDSLIEVRDASSWRSPGCGITSRFQRGVRLITQVPPVEKR